MSGTRVISTTFRIELSLFFLQGKAPKEIYSILTEKLACFLPGRAKDLALSGDTNVGGPRSGDRGKPCQGHVPTDREPFRNMEGRHSNTLQDELL